MKDLTEQQLQQLRDALVHNRSQIIEKALQRRHELSMGSDGILQLPDDNDVASNLSGEQLAVRLHDRERRLLRKIDATLARIGSDEYGYCEICDEFIGLARLKARPIATVCIECKEEQEREEQSKREPRRRPRSRNREEKRSEEPKRHGRSARRDRSETAPWPSEADLRVLSVIHAGEEMAGPDVESQPNAKDVS